MRCSFIFLLLMSCRAWAGDIYVHPQGNDNSLGTKDSPLCTIQRAVRMAREWRRTSDPRARGGVNIYLLRPSISTSLSSYDQKTVEPQTARLFFFQQEKRKRLSLGESHSLPISLRKVFL